MANVIVTGVDGSDTAALAARKAAETAEIFWGFAARGLRLWSR